MAPLDLRSAATVPTARSERWIKQLASHLGRKAEVQHDDDGGTVVVLGGGRCRMSGDATALYLLATAPDEDALGRVEHVVGGHLERFAAAEGLLVRWRR